MEPKQVMSARAGDLPAALREGEQVLIQGRISAAIFWKACGVLALALLVGLNIPQLGYFLCLVSVLTFAYAFLLKSILLIVVTNQRVFFRSGLIKVDTVQVRLERIESVEIQRTLIGHMMNYGTIVLTGTGSRFSYIPFLANAGEIRNVLDDLLYKRDKNSEAKRDGGGN